MKKIIVIPFLFVLLSTMLFASEFSWKAPKVAQSLLLDITTLPSGKLVAVGERGHIIWSVDNGENWQQAIVPTLSSLTAVYFVDENKGWAVGHDSVILATDDGGENWQQQFIAIEKEQPLFDVNFTDALHGIALGAYGLYLETTDGGKTWKDIYLESLDDPDTGLPHFYQLRSLTSGQLLMAGEAGLIAITDQQSKQWKRLSVDYSGSFFSAKELANKVLLAVGLRGNIFRSEDYGESWQRIDSNTVSSFFNVELSKDEKIVTVVGAEGIVLVSHDNGEHFQLNRRDDRFGMASIQFLPSQRLLSVGEKGVADISDFITPSN